MLLRNHWEQRGWCPKGGSWGGERVELFEDIHGWERAQV